MAKDDEQGKTPTIAEIMQVLDRLTAERKADNAERKADNEEARVRQEAADKRQEAADKRQEAIDRQVRATSEEVQAMSEKLQATGEYVQEIGKQVGDVGNLWGKIAEYLVAGDLARILQQRFGIAIDHSSECLSGRYQGKKWEVDVFAANGEIALVGEVKLTLTIEAVDKFVEGNLRNFHLYMPAYRDKKIYGMLAFVKMNRSEERQLAAYVHSLGLLLVRVIDNTFHLLTPSEHELKNYNTAEP